MPYDIVIKDRVRDTDPAHWEALSNHLPASMGRSYLHMIESLHQGDTDMHYALIRDERGPVGILYFQTIRFKGEQVRNYFRREENEGFLKALFYGLMGLFFKWMQWDILSTGNMFFTGDRGVYFLPEVTDEDASKLIGICFDKVRSQSGRRITAYMMNNVYDDDAPGIRRHLADRRFAAYPVDPDMFLRFRPEWQHFQDYLQSLRSKYRVRLRKVLKDSAPVTSRQLSAEEAEACRERIYRLYRNTADQSLFNLGYLDKGYFRAMYDLFPGQFEITGYFLGERLVGFISVWDLQHSLDVNYMGLDYPAVQPYNLYNRMLADLVEMGVVRKSGIMHLGRTATAIKSTIGAQPRAMKIHLTSHRKPYAWGLRHFQAYFGSPEYVIRHPFRPDS